MNKKLVLCLTLALILNGIQITQKKVKAEQNQPITLNQGIMYHKVNFEPISNIDTLQHMKDIINTYKEKQGFISYYDDSSGYYYIAIMYGLKPSGGYSINVKSVEDIEGKTKILVEEKEPAPGTMIPMVVTYPYTVIKVTGITSNITVESTSGTTYTNYSEYVKKVDMSQLTDKHWKDLKSYNNVSTNKQWTIKFNKPVMEENVNSLNIYVVDHQGNKVAAKLLLDKDKKSVIVIPVNHYDFNQSYYLFISNSKNSPYANTIKGFRMQFTTKSDV
ncbi:protease complex subunit PrcB family protein [Clostridium sp. DJ247]|uniref:protease complex subunit PrcB family protein n=1 Tax=Clostridium sp. DJ247 TaxID=2726188 RepID=UPI001629560C|nr:protease complex subunit PrcB family protein [Clostridium sp. DJ247]MBC2581880.1 protease complex subunit PrcB family protein [Clostridium sp. DJ247]